MVAGNRRFLCIALLICGLLLCGCESGAVSQKVALTLSPIPTLRPWRTPSATPDPTPAFTEFIVSTPIPDPSPAFTEFIVPAPTPDPTMAFAQEPDPPPPEGDFSRNFPAGDTGANAYLSFQSDDVRIAIERFEKNGVIYYVADFWIRNIDSLRAAFARDKYMGGREPMKTLIENNDAILASSGDYCGSRDYGTVIRNGQAYRDVRMFDVCVLYHSGEMKTYTNDEWAARQSTEKGVVHAWSFGPMLLDKDSLPLKEFNGTVSVTPNPRAAMGYYEPGHYCFVSVEGRSSTSKGMTMPKLAELFYELGCKTAYNLDGGDSAILAFDGQYVNEPSGGGREQYDIIYIRRP